MKVDIEEKTGEIKRMLKSSLAKFEANLVVRMEPEEITSIHEWAKKTHQLDALILKHTPYLGPKDSDRQYASELTHGHVKIKRLLDAQIKEGQFNIQLVYESPSERDAEVKGFIETLKSIKEDAASPYGLSATSTKSVEL
jgi:hypothetical protein